jgi:DNA-binding protein HU-beta
MWPMNKRELAKAVAVQADVDLRTVAGVLDSLQEVVTAVVSKGEPVAISGFAKFVKVDRPARMGRNPATGEQIHIKASKKARITAVKAFKDAVMQPAKAPKLKRGVWPTSDEAVKAAGRTALAAPKAAGRKATPAKKTAKKAASSRRAPAGKRGAATRRTAPTRRTTKKATGRRR